MSFKTFFLITFLLLAMTSSLRLLPAPVNPLQMTGNSNFLNSPQNVVVSFSFPSAYAGTLGPNINTSNGLPYHQFLAVSFPFFLGPTDLVFDVPVGTPAVPKFGCALTDNNGLIYVVTPVAPQTTENSIAYCRLDDITNSPLKVGPLLIFTLTISLNLVKINSTNYFRSVGVFTSTSAMPNKMILDSLPIIGTMAQYPDWHTVNSIASFTAVVTNIYSNIIYPNTSFTLTVIIKLTATVQIANHLLVFRYPGAYINGPTSIVSTALSLTDSTQFQLAGTLTLGTFDTNTFYIAGITDTNLIAGRSFSLTISGWKAGDTSIGIAGPLELLIYYKNTYSIFSYTTVNTFTIAAYLMTATVNHPEYWDIYRNGAWPLTFTITPTAADITTQGYIVIQHFNALDTGTLGGNKVSFVASTCDFSSYATSGYDAFGLRPSCYPLQMENGPYASFSSSAAYPGSGIFYKITNTMTALTSYPLTVWVFADNCGGANYNWATTGTTTAGYVNTFTSPTFSVTFYKKINPALLGTARFNVADQIGTQIATFSQKCWNNYLSQNVATTGPVYPQSFIATDYVTAGSLSVVPGATLPVAAGTASYFLYREFTDWSSGILGSSNMITTAAGTACVSTTWECFPSATASFTNTGFIYGTSLLTGSYFNVRLARPRVGNTDAIQYYFPSPVNDVAANTPKWYSGKIVYQLPFNWFIAGDAATTCYASWNAGALQVAAGAVADTLTVQTKLMVLNGGAGVGTVQANNSNFFASNAMLAGGTVTGTQIDSTSVLNTINAPTGTSSIIRIISSFTAGGLVGATSAFQFLGDATKVLTAGTAIISTLNLAFFSSCYKWKVMTPIKSVYTYIDIQIQFHYMATNGPPNLPITNARFIKLYPEGGVFFDISAAGTRSVGTPASVNPYTNHQTIVASGGTGASTVANYAVCLIELNGAAVQLVAAGDTASTVLGIWLFGGVLIESDYNDASSTYPVGSAISTSVSYGMQSAFAMNPTDNAYISGVIASSHNTLSDLILNNAVTVTATTVVSVGSFRSGYMFYMGSNLLITGLSTGIVTAATTPPNLLIPYYCPVALNSINTGVAITGTPAAYLSNFPLITALWMTQPSFSSVTSVNRVVEYTGSGFTFSLLYPQTPKTHILNKAGDTVNVTGNYVATLRWAAYGSANPTNVLYINLGQLDRNYVTAATNENCTGFSLFLQNTILWDSTILAPSFTGATTNAVYKNLTKQFYVLGKAFNSAAFGGFGQGATFMTLGYAAFDNLTLSTNQFIGLARPTVDLMISGTGLVNKIGFFCVTSSATLNTVVTNYNTDFNFYLDWFILATNVGTWATPVPSWDKQSENYLNDPAGNFKFTVTPPAPVPLGSLINFTGATFTTNTMCGMQVLGSTIYQDCTNSGGTITCVVPLALTTAFNICCYSVTLADPLGLNLLQINYPTNAAYVTSHITQVNYNASYTMTSGATGANYVFVTQNVTAPAALVKNATLGPVNYSQVSQDSGYGKATYTITFFRDITRDSVITIVGDMTAMQIPGTTATTPRCLATFSSVGQFGASWDIGDGFIDQCVVNLTSTSAPVQIITKKHIYKCGTVLNIRTLYFSIWPVVLVNYSISTTSLFKVNLNLYSGTLGSLTPIAATGSNVTINTAILATKPLASTADTLCTVSLIFPNIVGEQSDYNFDFDLDSNKALLATSIVNEFTIFWPYQWYGSYIPNVICSYAGVLINCLFTDEGILNIRYPSNFPVGSNKKITIVVSSVHHPGIDVTTYSFPCTVNNLNFSTGVRTNLLVGSGKITQLQYQTFPTGTNIGALRFVNTDPNAVSDATPRGLSTHTFRIAFDNLLTAQPVLSLANPTLHVYFPSDYNLFLYSTIKPTAVINEYTADAFSIITKTNSFTPSSVTLTGNRVTIILPTNTYAFPTNWRYWDILVSNINNPADTTTQNLSTQPVTLSTRPFSVTMTNDVQTIVYRTNLNLNQYSSTLNTINITTPLSLYLSNNRGNVFAFNGTKWAVDIYTVQANLNVLNVKTGRYIMSYFNIKAQSVISLLPSFTVLSLTDPTFKTSLASYNISTSYMQTVSFYIGVACGTAPGAYIINFTSSDVTTFTNLVPVMVTLDSSKPATITTQPSYNVPAAGSVWIGYTLSDVNFEPLTVTWVAGDNNKNDSTATFTSVIIPTATVTPTNINASTMYPIWSVFAVTSVSTTLNAQTFKTSDPTLCFTFNGSTTISFTVSGAIAVITPAVVLTSSFVYANGDTDTTLLKNQIRFTYSPSSLYPAYIYCALVCINNSYPADADIKIPKVPSTGIIQFYSNIINTSTPINIIFSNLVRGQQYHMRCLLESTNGDPTQRTPASVNFELYSAVGGNGTTIIAPSATVSPQCANFQFTTEPGMITRRALVNFCQRLYSAPGYFMNGCVYCSFNDLSYLLPGLFIPTNITCSATGNRNRLRFLQSTSTVVANATVVVPVIPVNTTSVAVCPVPSLICQTDPTQGSKLYTDYYNLLTTGLNNIAAFNTVLGLSNVPLYTTTPFITVTDIIVPNLANFSVTVGVFSALGNVAWTATFVTPINCKWQISALTTVPIFSAIWVCADPSWCGQTRINSSVQSYQTSASNLKAFTLGTTYNIFYACYNDIPGAQKQSIVQNAGTFFVPAAVILNNSTTVPASIDSNFLNISIMAIMMVIGLLF